MKSQTDLANNASCLLQKKKQNNKYLELFGFL